MQDLRFTPLNRTSSLTRSPSRPDRNESLLRANRASLAHLGQGDELSADPKGRVLRQLLLNAGLDPCELATRACISLAKLYEIEMGFTTRFYSATLREQAAKRVARLLSTDWKELVASASDTPPRNHVVQLQSTCASKQSSVACLHRPAIGKAELENQSHLPDDQDPSPMGLSTPCASTLQTAEHQAADSDQPGPLSRWAVTILWALVAMLVSASTILAINEWSPYRVIWPWEPSFPWQLSLPFDF